MAIRVDASTDVLTSSAGMPSSTNFTLMGWFKMTSDPNTEFARQFELYGDTDNTIRVAYDYFNDQILLVYIKATTVNIYQQPAWSPGVGNWFFNALVSDGATMKLYYGLLTDAALTLTQANNSWGGITINNLYISANPSANRYFIGDTAGVKMWDAALTAAEIEAERRTLLPKRLANVNRAYPMVGDTVAQAERDHWLSKYGLTTSGLTVADGPPVSYGGRILMPQVAAATLPTLSFPGVQDITATSARPKVTLTYA